MAKKADEGRDRGESEAGLCARCVGSRVVVSDRGSRFWLCERGVQGGVGFVKYPRLPVVRCGGFRECGRGLTQGEASLTLPGFSFGFFINGLLVVVTGTSDT